VEDLQVIRYAEGQEFEEHTDWFGGLTTFPDRKSTFFATLASTCDDCGTMFPQIAFNWTRESAAWCEYIDCNNQDVLIVKPRAGGALFWLNLLEDGTGDERTRHAGLPVPIGKEKYGLNIWTRDNFV